MYLMSEGFIYILFGAILVKLIVTYSKNIKFIYLLLPIAMFPWFVEKRLTIYAALLFSSLIYFLVNKKFIKGFLLIVLITVFTKLKWSRLIASFACRPVVWKKLTAMIIKHPFVGMGFDNSLNPENAIFHTAWGGIYIHNDLLNIGRCLGILSMIFILWFILNSIKQIGKGWQLILFLTIILTSLFQMTIFIPWKAAIMLIIISLILAETYSHKKEAV